MRHDPPAIPTHRDTDFMTRRREVAGEYAMTRRLEVALGKRRQAAAAKAAPGRRTPKQVRDQGSD
jgi:hypothetical protein